MKPRLFLFIGFFILLLLVIYALLEDRISFDWRCEPYPIAEASTDGNLPPFIKKVWPPPGSEIPRVCYQNQLQKTLDPFDYSGLGIEILTGEIDDFSQGYTVENELYERVELIVDGSRVDPDSLIIWSDATAMLFIEADGSRHQPNESSLYKFTYPIVLDRGTHYIEVIISSNIGKLFEYSWEFEIK